MTLELYMFGDFIGVTSLRWSNWCPFQAIAKKMTKQFEYNFPKNCRHLTGVKNLRIILEHLENSQVVQYFNYEQSMEKIYYIFIELSM